MPPAAARGSLLRRAVPYLILSLMIGSWVAMAELLDNVQVCSAAARGASVLMQGGLGGQATFAKPMFITWVIHSTYGVFLLPWALLARSRVGGAAWRVGACGSGGGDGGSAVTVQPCCGARLRCSVGACLGYRRPLSHFVWTGGVMSCIAALGALTWYRSLPLTTVAANNTIYQSSCVFVFLLSVAVLGERVTWNKIAAVALSVVGVLLISMFPSATHASNVHPSAAGYAWLLASTLCYAGLQVRRGRYGCASPIAAAAAAPPPPLRLCIPHRCRRRRAAAAADTAMHSPSVAAAADTAMLPPAPRRRRRGAAAAADTAKYFAVAAAAPPPPIQLYISYPHRRRRAAALYGATAAALARLCSRCRSHL